MKREKILVVEDRLDFVSLYTDKLRAEKFQVRVASNGTECLKLIDEDRPDLIILDLVMPVMDGFTLLENIKKKTECQNMPTIVFSMREYPEDKKKAFQLGASDYLNKIHTTPNLLLQKINQILSQTTEKKETASYWIAIKESLFDAPKIAKDSNLPMSFKCSRCNTSLLLQLTSQTDSEKLEFKCRFCCPNCTQQKTNPIKEV
ncbi:response regulator [bacterium]|nr:response regulator [bacterium]